MVFGHQVKTHDANGSKASPIAGRTPSTPSTQQLCYRCEPHLPHFSFTEHLGQKPVKKQWHKRPRTSLILSKSTTPLQSLCQINGWLYRMHETTMPLTFNPIPSGRYTALLRQNRTPTHATSTRLATSRTPLSNSGNTITRSALASNFTNPTYNQSTQRSVSHCFKPSQWIVFLSTWKKHMRTTSDLRLKLASNQPVRIEGPIELLFLHGDLHFCLNFGFGNNFVVRILLGTSYIDEFITGLFEL